MFTWFVAKRLFSQGGSNERASRLATGIATFGVAIGLALQGSLANLAGGIMIIAFHPFKIGDFIEGNGYSGTVEDVSIFYTKIITPDNKSVMLPNGGLSNAAIVNYSEKDLRLKIMYKFKADIPVKEFTEFIENNNIDVNNLDSFIISDVEEYEAQTKRYDFDSFDNKYI